LILSRNVVVTVSKMKEQLEAVASHDATKPHKPALVTDGQADPK